MPIDDITQAVYAAMKAGVWYRPADLAGLLQADTDSVRYALRRLLNGGLIVRDGDNNRRVYARHP